MNMPELKIGYWIRHINAYGTECIGFVLSISHNWANIFFTTFKDNKGKKYVEYQQHSLYFEKFDLIRAEYNEEELMELIDLSLLLKNKELFNTWVEELNLLREMQYEFIGMNH
jgi:hypothetical protein